MHEVSHQADIMSSILDIEYAFLDSSAKLSSDADPSLAKLNVRQPPIRTIPA